MLKLNASYSKKVPTPEKFSSESYLACIEVELPTGQTARQLQDKIHETFELVKASVESEIAGHSAKDTPVKQQRPQARPEASTDPATNKQIQFLLKLGKGCNKGLPELVCKPVCYSPSCLPGRCREEMLRGWPPPEHRRG